MPPAQMAKRIWSAIGKRYHAVSGLESLRYHFQTWIAYPGNLVVHSCKAKINPVGDSGAGDEKAACYRNVRAALGIFGAHFGLVGRD